jgi:RHS repeat-associated protein
MNTSGVKTGELRYKAFGETRFMSGTTPTKRQYTGQINEADIGLYFYNARYYDPSLGRFTQADTIIPQPGNPQAWDRYAYVLNNPLAYTDPSGHFLINDRAKTMETCGPDNRECGGGLLGDFDIFGGNDDLRHAWTVLNSTSSGHDSAQALLDYGIPVTVGRVDNASAETTSKEVGNGKFTVFKTIKIGKDRDGKDRDAWGIIIDTTFASRASPLEIVMTLGHESYQARKTAQTGQLNSQQEEYNAFELERDIAIDIGLLGHPSLIFSPDLDYITDEKAKYERFFEENTLGVYLGLPLLPSGGFPTGIIPPGLYKSIMGLLW